VSAPDDVAASLVDSLASEGAHVDEGSFTLDPAKAREKLRAYQLADAHEWILLAISAGYVATGGRGPVHVYAGARASVQFSGVSFGAAQLEHCFAAVLGRQRGPADQVLRLLGLAANAALSLGAHVEIESTAPGGQRHTLRVSPEGAQVIEHDEDAGVEGSIRIDVHGRGKRRAARERELVVERCLMTSTAIFLDDQQFSQGPTFTTPLQRVDVTLGEAVIGKAAFERYRADAAKALIINRGVLVETVTLSDLIPGFVAIVDVDLPTDLSQRQILRDEAWERVLAAIRQAHDALPRPPRLDPGGLASEGDGSSRSTATVMVVALLGFALIVTVVGRWIFRDERPQPENLWRACERGDRFACASAIEQTTDPDQLRVLWRQSCDAGETTHCLRYADAIQFSDPESSLAVLIDTCRVGSVEACKRALPRAPDPRTAAELEHAWCFHGREHSRCLNWIADAQATCADSTKCVVLREILRGICMQGTTGEFCLEAGWMAHLGYGGPHRQDDARALFERGCKAQRRVACEWQRRPPVSEHTCAKDDAWACYSLGYEAYQMRRDVDTSVAYFERACELGLALACDAPDLVRAQTGPVMAFPSYE
jgi:TPR repeat protein